VFYTRKSNEEEDKKEVFKTMVLMLKSSTCIGVVINGRGFTFFTFWRWDKGRKKEKQEYWNTG